MNALKSVSLVIVCTVVALALGGYIHSSYHFDGACNAWLLGGGSLGTMPSHCGESWQSYLFPIGIFVFGLKAAFKH